MDKKKNNSGFRLIEICKNNNLSILNGRFGHDKNKGAMTFRNVSVIDYAIVSMKCFELLHDFQINDVDRIFSDGHSFLLLKIKIKTTTDNKQHAQIPSSNRTYLNKADYYHFVQNFDSSKMEALLNRMQTCDLASPDEVNNFASVIADTFQAAAIQTNTNKITQSTQKDTHNKPWFGRECKTARRNYHLAKRIHHNQKSDENKDNLLTASKHYKKTMNKYINKYRKNKCNKLRYMSTHEPKEYWKFLNSLKLNKQTDTPNANTFFEHYKNIFASEDIHEDPQDLIHDANSNEESLNQPFTSAEVEKCIKKLKSSKSPGYDNILNEYIKLTKDQMLPVYATLFNIILETGYIPEQWLIGKIKPIYKNKGDASNPDNYRPIMLLSCLGKLFTALLCERLNLYVEENLILKENQAGFRKDYSTTDHIFVLHALTQLMKFEKKKLFCSFIDFSKAFDSVWRVGLWRKLLRQDINGNFFRVIHNIYNNIKSCVSVNDESSSFFITNCGVRQGDNLSPILFSMFLNDLEDHMEADNLDGITLDLFTDELFVYTKLYILLYADDTIILADSETSLQESLNSFNAYCNEWRLTINKEKSKVMIFGARKTDDFNFYIGETKLEIVNSYKYLGTHFSPSGSFLTARKHIATQANKAMHLLNLRINNLNLPIDLQLKLFDHTVLPIMTYGCEVWGFENCKILEPIHNQFLRSILRARKSTPMYMIYAELGRYPIEITIKTRSIAFWSRIISSKQSKLSYLIYHKLLNTPRFQSKWVNNIKEILNSCGRPDIWETPPINTNIVALIKRNLVDQYHQEWHSKLDVSTKGKNYHLFKDSMNLEGYLLKLPKPLTINLAKFRTSNHHFPCETGRYNDIDYAERKCRLCDKNDIGDEMHYLFICPHFHEERVKFIPKYYYTRTNIIKFKELMNTQNENKLIKLAQFAGILVKTVK